MIDDPPANSQYFGPNDIVDISTHKQWWNCTFEDCTFASDSLPKQVFWRCHFTGRASEWLRRQMGVKT